MLSPLQQSCVTIVNALVEPDPEVGVLREVLVTCNRESKDQDEKLQILHTKLTALRRKDPVALRGALQFLQSLLDIELNIDAVVPKGPIKAAEPKDRTASLPFEVPAASTES